MMHMTRRGFLQVGAAAVARAANSGRWPLGINTYCLRFQRWNDRQLIDYCVSQKLDAIFLQDSLDPGSADPKHWAEVRSWTRDAGLHLETGGGAILPKRAEDFDATVTTLRRQIERAKAMGSPIVRALLAADRQSMPPGSVEQHIETTLRVIKAVRPQLVDAGLKLGMENHKELQAWEMRQLIETAGKDIAGAYLDTGNPVFVFEDPMTTIEELGPLAVSFHLRDSVVYELPEGIAVQWVPLGEGTPDFRQLVAQARQLMPPGVHVYCKPITARPPVTLPIYRDEFWKLFPRARAADMARFLALAKRGRPYEKPHLTADVAGERDRYMDALKVQQLDHMARSLAYCRTALSLGTRS